MALADEINKMILKIVESLEITSANPTHINHVIQANEMDKPDLEALISQGGDDTDVAKQQKKTDNIIKKVEKWDDSNIGEVARFTSSQFGNLKEFVQNPVGFIFQTFIKRFTRGVGVVFLALAIFEAVKWIISELLKPGRLLDIRFKRDIRNEIVAFRRREDQQKLRQGFSSIIVTSMPRMRGGANQAAQTVNTLDYSRAGNVEAFDGFGQNTMLLESSGGGSMSKKKWSGGGGYR